MGSAGMRGDDFRHKLEASFFMFLVVLPGGIQYAIARVPFGMMFGGMRTMTSRCTSAAGCSLRTHRPCQANRRALGASLLLTAGSPLLLRAVAQDSTPGEEGREVCTLIRRKLLLAGRFDSLVGSDHRGVHEWRSLCTEPTVRAQALRLRAIQTNTHTHTKHI